ncbi:polyisoprenoid-binding protein [Alteromonas aestuariivivens]|uniref:Polyisoprenoid-binding protein n=1 Tax=Alteromonas aestuariivivens TaxID=1938339 RepID=A0A3D8M6D2_9ALTE|nr:YceI family protein [Alteromonas aestuariivivens]RDV25094.1 polyisoprenoid-binding protein [Alteromonas aestuariivivens]
MKKQIAGMLAVLVLTSCLSWVLAKADFVDMPQGTYVLDTTHASVVWKVSHMGLSNYTALFTRFEASIELNPEDLEKSRVTARIDPLSIETHYPHPDEEDFNSTLAQDPEWFNAGEFTSIDFVSTKIEMISANTALMTGTLTLLGQTRPITFDVILNGGLPRHPLSGKPALGVSATAVIQRSQWGMSKHVPTIGDDVTVQIEAEFYLPSFSRK